MLKVTEEFYTHFVPIVVRILRYQALPNRTHATGCTWTLDARWRHGGNTVALTLPLAASAKNAVRSARIGGWVVQAPAVASALPRVQPSASVTEGHFMCLEHGKRFSWGSTLKIHQHTHTVEKPSLGKCSKSFSEGEPGATPGHQWHHTAEQPLCCSDEWCFSQKKHLLKHQKTHTCPAAHTCPECAHYFYHKVGLYTHQHTHAHVHQLAGATLQKHLGQACCPWPALQDSLEKAWLGPYSSWAGSWSQGLGEPCQFICSECGKSFLWSFLLNVHQRIHTGKWPYLCPECGQYFSQKPNLMCHQRYHTGERPYCLPCGHSFSQKQHLLKHQRVHGLHPARTKEEVL
ncbi:LOW QUALITY PROTEIN: zinc finger protein 775 [Rhynchocyon petersi]